MTPHPKIHILNHNVQTSPSLTNLNSLPPTHHHINLTMETITMGVEKETTKITTSAIAPTSSVYSSRTPPHEIEKKLCPEEPPGLIGLLKIKETEDDWESIASRLNSDSTPIVNGMWRPADCTARDKVAIIVVYRNREAHLKSLLNHLHPILKRQQLDYGIFVIEQLPGSRFNRALLFNIGHLESLKIYNFTCFIFHDVDLLPEDDRNIYKCGASPRHMTVAINKFNYRLPYANIFGGACALSLANFTIVNGFSNLYFGWGGEDDDMFGRIRAAHMKIYRYPIQIARYTMIRHSKEKGNEVNPIRFKLMKTTGSRMMKDGLNSIKYTVVKKEGSFNNLAYLVQVTVPEKELLNAFKGYL